MESDSPSTAIRVTVDEISPDQDKRALASLVTDSGDVLTVPVGLLPRGVRIGDVLLLSFTQDEDEREQRRQRITDLQRRLFGGG